ncbi:MAG: hypothetical protein EHM72_18425 [Calditrichaeota bacterium]|nr:MAG: hypothetical protein EHM72_18425 [Calditrichota bacterium]
MPMTKFLHVGCLLLLVAATSLLGTEKAKPVTPKASVEAKALLDLFTRISGHYTLSGQHNYPNTRDRNSQFAAKYIGKTPAVWSTDMGFAQDGDTDSYLARPDIVEEAKRQHQLGSIITICWHAVPPTADEPVTFRAQPGASPDSLASVQGKLLDQQFQDLLTPGTKLHQKWCAQVDSVAFYLRKLQQARVPILWRPYHEMNGDWFWWGGRLGPYNTRALYRQIFDRLVNHHKLNNLIWVWSVDRPNKPEMNFSHYYPGDDYLDILALDVYGSDFNPTYYDSLLALANGKPLVLGEVGNPPTPGILASQPQWSYWVTWAGMVRNTSKSQYTALKNDPRLLFKEDQIFSRLIAPFRSACGLTPFTLPVKTSDKMKPNFNGMWIFNEEASELDNMGAGALPYKLQVTQSENDLMMSKSFIVEWGDDRITEESVKLDGSETKSEFMNNPRIMTANWSDNGDTLTIFSQTTFNRGGRSMEMKVSEKWNVKGPLLVIRQNSTTFRGERQITLRFDKE